MRHKSDIIEALADPRSRFSDLENAFCALVGWPQVDMIRGMTGTDDAIKLLGAVASALVEIGDTRIMPPDTTILLEDMARQRGQSIVESTYMSGALYVRNHLGRWRDSLKHAKTDT